MTATTSPLLTMNDGRGIPQLGLGVYKVADAEAARVVELAIDAGYRHVDTATLYNNERGVGDGVRASGVPRDEIFVTTKVWDDDHGFDNTRRAFDTSLELLGFDYVDLYLIHWPVPSKDLFVETWRALEAIKADGRALSIGVSNFAPHHLDRLLAETETVPAINQVELHPWLPQREVRDFDTSHGILTEAWSPLARGRLIGDRVLDAIAAKHERSAAQVVIRWHLQLGNVVIPKSVTASRITENFEVFDFELDAADLAAIAGLESGVRTGMEPDAH
ncbi:aldo/keto reductase [Glaciihabitans sp. INWT7]|uniref:aldo/keto reductase n=1 Tax=Glaciihabitans sp. INWT7 TaxID=2596912 RepID=UPI001623AC95|nr:aldo/keto reductase [Glaciihabitans sp. INWT7]QNE47739.1 aldo/keto reductase [Glaciihabitans sp. INWT7]